MNDSWIARVERRTGLTYPGLALLVIGLWGTVLARLLRNRGMSLLVYAALLLLAVAWVLGRRRLSIDADRSKIPGRLRPGQPVDAVVTLTSERGVNTLIVEEHIDPSLGRTVRVPVPSLPAGEAVEHEYTFRPTRRGKYQVGPLVAEWSDPFGLTRRRVEIAPPIDIIVHPSTERVTDRISARELEDPPLRPPVLKPWPTGYEFYGMRDYADGDDPRRIVWRAVGKYDRYMVRESEQGIVDRVNIFCDSDREFHSPGEISETFEKCVSVAASLGAAHIKDGFSVTLDLNTTRVCKALRGPAARIPFLDALATAEMGPETLADALDRLLIDPGRFAHNVVITPHITHEVSKRVKLLVDRGTHVLVVFVIWDDTDPGALHRAGSLGCPVIEMHTDTRLAPAFAHVVRTR